MLLCHDGVCAAKKLALRMRVSNRRTDHRLFYHRRLRSMNYLNHLPTLSCQLPHNVRRMHSNGSHCCHQGRDHPRLQ